MTNNAEKINDEFVDYLAEGFKRVPVVAIPPKIKWGEEFLSWDDQKKIAYLMKFAEAMNHAAATIQDERDALGRLLELKEEQLHQLQIKLETSNLVLESELVKMNEDRQQRNAHVKALNARIRELECGA